MKNKFCLPILFLLFLSFITTNIFGQKQLFKAIYRGDIKSVRSYISKGIDPAASYSETLYDGFADKKYTYSFGPLEYAAWADQFEVVKLLMADKGKIGDYQNSLNKAFSSSISSDNMEMIRFLLDAGADVNARCQNCYGRAAIHIALEYENFDLFNELVKKGARLDVKDNKARTLLHSVATNGNTLIAAELLKANLDINARDEKGATPVSFAAANGFLRLFKFFEENGADLSLTENDGRNILMNAVVGENDTLVSYLIGKKIDVNIADKDNWSPLMYACNKNNLQIARTLINAGADVNIESNEGETPFVLSIYNKNSEMARVLMDSGADFMAYDFRPLAKKNIKDKDFLKYLDEKYKEYQPY